MFIALAKEGISDHAKQPNIALGIHHFATPDI
jgi:hypothetical protein